MHTFLQWMTQPQKFYGGPVLVHYFQNTTRVSVGMVLLYQNSWNLTPDLACTRCCTVLHNSEFFSKYRKRYLYRKATYWRWYMVQLSCIDDRIFYRQYNCDHVQYMYRQSRIQLVYQPQMTKKLLV